MTKLSSTCDKQHKPAPDVLQGRARCRGQSLALLGPGEERCVCCLCQPIRSHSRHDLWQPLVHLLLVYLPLSQNVG